MRFYFRRPSLSTMLGITREKKRIKRRLGIYNNPLWKATHAVPNAERRFKRRIGYYSTPMKWIRWLSRQ